MTAARFPLGRLVATPGALATAERHSINLVYLLARHASGDWGELDAEDRHENEYSVSRELRILSAYGQDDAKLWVITEADRSATTILRPDEY